ncbi:cyclic-di-AMP receptor [uncultured Robinsoniella sp.]|uniref:cyclic-di-AMP receptor n=1 Tax=uncultured Robinsoniella sp. TaxID=904190 RepID=UPI00374F37B2
MKMIFAIVHDEDGGFVIDKLNKSNFMVTKLATTGGFLRRGNTTLLIGTEDDKVEQVIDIIKEECSTRKQVNVNTPYVSGGVQSISYATVPMTVEFGGATIFVVDVEQHVKI